MTPESAPTPAAIPFRRLHPTTLLQGLLRTLPGFVVLLIPVLAGRGGGGHRFFLAMALLYALIGLPATLLAYLRFRYRITPEQVEIVSGILSRQHRSIPIDRIQRVEVDRPLLHRLFGTARVRLMTGSGTGAEGELDAVALDDALAFRATVRRLQARLEQPADPAAESTGVPVEAEEPEAEEVFRLTPGLLLRAGAMRFSLVYIALAFSGMQFVGLTVEDVVDWIERTNLIARIPFFDLSPLLALAFSVGVAVVLSWMAGLLVTVVRFHGFTLRADARRLYTERGLGGRFERAIPRSKVQAVLYGTNPITRRFGYAQLSVQTMGLDDSGAGREVVVPLARLADVSALSGRLLGHPAAEVLRPVSRRFVRRRGLRYTVYVVLGSLLASRVWEPALGGLALVPLAWWLAWAQWRAHGYAFDGRVLVVQHGALWRRQWHLPLAKFQTVERWANLFQRRLGLASVYVDTAGAPDVGAPVVEDLPEEEARALADRLYGAFEALVRARPEPPLPEPALAESPPVPPHGGRLPGEDGEAGTQNSTW